MSRKASYKDCLNFIENVLHINLLNYQKEIIKCFCEGKTIITPHCCGRTTCADAYGKYIVHLLDKNDYNTKPDVIIPHSKGMGYYAQTYVDNEPIIDLGDENI